MIQLNINVLFKKNINIITNQTSTHHKKEKETETNLLGQEQKFILVIRPRGKDPSEKGVSVWDDQGAGDTGQITPFPESLVHRRLQLRPMIKTVSCFIEVSKGCANITNFSSFQLFKQTIHQSV